jgi:hypothetical protein
MKYLIIFVFILSFTACKNKTNTDKSKSENTEITSSTINNDATNIDKPSMEDAAKYVGKKPSEVNLFSQYNLEKRIDALLKNDAQNFKDNLNETTPIMKDGEILYFIGCKAGDCKAMKFFVMLDMLDTNVNVTVINNGTPKSYEESAIIGMTDQIAREFQRILSSPGL